MERSKILSLFFALAIAAMILPEMQRLTGIFRMRPLQGAFELDRMPLFSIGSFLDGTFQPQFERSLEDHVGFRPLLVRIRNQIDFMLFKKAHAEGVIIAKEGVIIEDDYIKEYLGQLFIGKNTIEEKLRRVKFVQDTLAKRGIHLALVFTPGKASFHNDLIPRRYHPNQKTLSNYEYFSKICIDQRINLLDLNSYFLQLKPSSPHPLYPKYGTHWSVYGMSLAADTLVKYIEFLNGKPMNHIKTGEIELSRHMRDTDFDGGESMNLLWRPRMPLMAYPEIKFENDPSKHRPMVLAVGDSYYWNIYNTRIPQNIFANRAFWYYHQQIYPEFYTDQTTIDQIDIKAEIEKQEVILVMITERFFYTAFWNFTDDLYSLYKPGYQPDYIYNYSNTIRRDRQWLDHVIEKAKSKKITLQEMVRTDAEFLYFHDFHEKLPKTPENYILHYEIAIKLDWDWHQQVKDKAWEQGVSIEEMIRRDALWMYEHDILGMHR